MRKWIAGLLTGAVIAWTAPALAHPEPTAAIVGATMTVFKYPDSSTALVACDGTETFPFDNARVHVNVWTESAPSEHFLTEVKFFQRTYRNGKPVWDRLWENQWVHQNVSPAGFGNATEMRFNVWHLEPGSKYRFELHLVGDISGESIWRICTFNT